MFTIQVAKKLFFDRKSVADPLARGRDRALSKFGAYVRQRARTSVRKRKGTSPAGSPPFSHVGTLRRGILFGRDPDRGSVVIGPVLLGSQDGSPERLEYGGTGVVGPRGKRRTATYEPRPFMRPAFAAELPRAPQLFKDMIR